MVSSKDLETGDVSIVSWSPMQTLTFFLDYYRWPSALVSGVG